MTAYYNDNNPECCQWLRELIKMGLIADGEVDERSITDVTAADLRGFTQHHFFAGIGVWSYSLRRAGWSDNMPVCTASLPCQPFSTAGKGGGRSDDRHLLPHFIELARQLRFHTIFGEQVEGAIKHGWLDDLQTVMEAEGYTVGHCVLGAHSINAAHIRQRLFWTASRMGHTNGLRQQGERGGGGEEARTSKHGPMGDIRLADSDNARQSPGKRGGENYWDEPRNDARWGGEIEWLYCRDQKYRPIKSGIAPLVDGSARGMGHSSDSSISPNETSEARVMRLKGYGNAIQADVAAEFIGAVMECL